MFEGLAAWVLNMYIGEYLENLNTDQLSIDLLQGQIELENIPFKKTALSNFTAAICLRSGVLGKLTLNIPLTRLRSEPWVVTLSDINVVLEPNSTAANNDADVSSESKQTSESNEEENEKEKLELLAKQDLEATGIATTTTKDSQNSGGGWWGYVSSIVENIQLVVNNAHIRYIDEISVPGQTFACGVEIERFTVKTTDKQYKPGFVVRGNDESIYKLFEFTGLSLYWDNMFISEKISQCVPRGRFLSEASFEVRLEKKCTKNMDDLSTSSSSSDKMDRTCYEIYTKFFNVLKLNFDQLQLDNIKLAVEKVKNWYFGEADDDDNDAPNVSTSTGDNENVSDVPFVATFEISCVSIELRNYLGESDCQPFVLCQGEAMLLKYVKEKVHISYIETSVGCIRIKDLLECSLCSSTSNLQYLLSTRSSNEGKMDNQSSFLSSSCPELTDLDDSDYVLLSSSLPGALSPTFPGKIIPFSTAPITPKMSRKTSLRADPLVRIRVTFIDAVHRDFESKYNKIQCQIEADFGNLDVVVNQETWVLLFDFFGFLTPPPSIDDPKEQKTSKELKKQIQVKCEKLTINLNKPKEKRILSKIIANEFRSTVLTEKAGVEIFGKVNGLSVEDCNSGLYCEKVNIKAPDKDLEFVVYKYTNPDVELKREFDAVLSVTSPEDCTYVHTQKFLMEFTTFWLQYAQLQEYYSQARAASLGMAINDRPSHGFRLKLTANLNRTTIVLPEYSSSQKCLIVQTSRICANNYFRFANSLESSKFYDDSAGDFNCLQDVLEINLFDCAAFVGLLSIGDEDVNNRKIVKQTGNLFDKVFPLDVTVVRNLDSSVCRNVPDMEIQTKFVDVVCQLHVNTYTLIKNLLEKNLGEDIPQTAANSQSQFRPQNPATMTILSGLIWRNLLLTLDFTNVVVVCSDSTQKFGRLNIDRAHFSFESFSDSTKEVDFVCYAGSIVDVRYDDEAANKRNNVFSTIFCPNSDSPPTSDETPKKKDVVIAEIHFFSHQETSKFTLLFRLARFIVISDWLSLAKAFLVARSSSDPTGKPKPRRMSCTPASLIRTTGVATRKTMEEEKLKMDNFEMKTNFTDSEIIFVENTTYRNSLATILKGTAVLNYKEYEFSTKFSCNANSIQIFNCAMDNRQDTEIMLTEPFNLTIELTPQPKKGSIVTKLLPIGLLDFGHVHVEHKLEVKKYINLSNVLAKFSYRDWLVFKSVLDAYSFLWSPPVSESKSTNNNSNSLSLEKIETKITEACLWLLDDSQDHRMPLIRITMKNAEFEQKPTKLLGESKEGFGCLNFSVDYFNQNVNGWEPLLEPWRLQYLSWVYYPQTNSLNFDISCRHEVLNLSISRIFLDQASLFLDRWGSISQTVASDFRTSYIRRSDFLPYLLRNECGSRLKFTIETTKLQKNFNNPKKVDWINVENGESAPFSFHSVLKMDDYLSELSFNKIVVRIDGWHEIGAINVDSVGTYFRLTRLNDVNKNASGLALSTPTYAHVIAAVTKDNEGRKIITIRSSLLFVNTLTDPLEIYLENISTYIGDFCAFVLPPGAVMPAPLKYTNCRIAVRPTGVWSVGFCKPISWQHVSSPGQISDCFRECTASQNEKISYKICVSVKREHFPDPRRYPELSLNNIVTLPGHTITFVPPLIVVNLLPSDLTVQLPAIEFEQHITPGSRLSISGADILNQIDMSFSFENFNSRELLKLIPAMILEERNFYLEVFDIKQRPFVLNVSAAPTKGGGLKVSISTPYWIVNKSGLPLIFKQEGSYEEAAGQFDEHETGKPMFPAIFSFADIGAPKQLALRIGRKAQLNCVPIWCNSFVLEPGITCKTLQLQKYDGSPSLLYNIGVEVRVGQGLYKDTKIVMLTPLFTLDNRSTFTLYVSQKCDVDANNPCCTIAPNCSMPWHWTRQDLDMLLCVKRSDLPYWSNGFRIDHLTSFHLTTRDAQGIPHLLRVEIVLHGAMYFVTFLDADTFPPPIRIENLSDVPILYQQKGCDANHLRTILRPHSEVNYGWDDQLQPRLMVLTVYGNKSIEYDLTTLGQHCPLTYENFFFIAFSASFDKSNQGLEVESELVLDVLPKGKVILNKKDQRRETQLWRMTADGMLMNIGVQKLDKPNQKDPMVLDILSCVDPKSYVPLMMHRSDHRRRLTQRWNFTEDGRLMCGMQNLYVQAGDRQLKKDANAVLGPTHADLQLASNVPPDEQRLAKHRQKPGSGSLNVCVNLDGPTRVLRISDIYTSVHELSPAKRKQVDTTTTSTSDDATAMPASTELQFSCSLNLEALAFSLITNNYEELLYCQMRGLLLNFRKERQRYTLSTSVLDLQADNQLINADRWTLLYVKPKYDEKGEASVPALNVHISWTPLPSYDSFESFIVSIGKAALFLDEEFVWKLVLFFEFAVSSSPMQQGSKPPNIDIERPDPQKARRCYFDNLSLNCRRLYLSVLTANVLPSELRRVKQRWNVPLVRFENAPVEIEPFQQMYYFETVNFLLDAFGKHLQQQLTSQAVKILGTVDFLGNPLGLFQDVSGGLRELFIEGNVSGFVRGVWHGVSNSSAKITSSVSEGVGKISMDESHRQLREAYRHPQTHSADPLGHFMTGVKGLGIGLYGGAVSIPTNMFAGLKKDGLEGFVIGTGKGIVGTVTKPVQGFLDLATGAATAAKEIVGGSGPPTAKFPACRLRPPRVTRSVQGTLPPYSASLAAGQESLRTIRNNNNEICLAMYLINAASNGETLYVLVSSEQVYVIKRRSVDDQDIVLTSKYSDLISCVAVLQKNATTNVDVPYLEFMSSALGSYSKTGNKPKKSLVKCTSLDIAAELSRQIMHAKQQYNDQQRSLSIPEDVSVEL